MESQPQNLNSGFILKLSGNSTEQKRSLSLELWCSVMVSVYVSETLSNLKYLSHICLMK